ncbi:factor-independent urate hydroxylase [Haloferax volcanii]|nr:urate oxidase [Haloferax volcanii]ELY36911.1 urate oxidase [Haloferax volcanii DS2]MBS8118007.1 urate oxidase [Haloferax volcanii]MBS8123019.1 urate oxidase [Haloferax volcanii]MBS8126887.1 urate oxidase [Haloferax volcanii]MBS8130753.1 urate oxidase [Haloferax volcanii]
MTAQQSPVDGDAPDSGEQRTMNYGKENVAVYRTYATPLEGVRTIPESSFDGRDNVLFGLDVRVQVEGEEFLPSFSEGDNTKVVATDSMKNFILHHAGEYDGATLEGFLEFVGSGFLDTYSQMSAVEVSADEIRFDELPVPEDDGDGYEASDLVFRVSDNESGYGSISLTRDDGTPVITDQTSGVTGLELVKVEGSSFTGYVQDEYTTLPEREDRTLYISLDIFWSYDDPEDALGEDPERYVPSEQVRDIAHVVFDEVDSNSIQDLIYQIGLRVLERYPQLASVRFEANNRTWLSVRDDLDGDASVLREPPAPTGFQQFSMDRGDLDEQ